MGNEHCDSVYSGTPISSMAMLLMQRNHISRFIIQRLWRPISDESSFLEPPPRYLVLSSDYKTIICHHPSQPHPISLSKPLRSPKARSDTLTDDQITKIKELRTQDPSIWTVQTLAKLFNVKSRLISNVAPAGELRRQQLIKEQEQIAEMRPHKRKLYLKKREEERQTKLKEAMTRLNYDFPGLKF